MGNMVYRFNDIEYSAQSETVIDLWLLSGVFLTTAKLMPP